MYKLAQVAHLAHLAPAASGSASAAPLERWRGPHAALGSAVPGVARYVQNVATASLGLDEVEDSPTAFDGYACIWFASHDSARAAMASSAWATMEADAAALMVGPSRPGSTAAVDEHVIIDGPMGPFKAVWFVRFSDEIRADAARTRDAHAYWIGTHGGAYGVKVPGIDRYVQNHVVGPGDGGAEPGFDGFSECWFQDRAAFDVTQASDEWYQMNADALNIFDRDWIVSGWSALLDERVVVGG